MPQLVCKATVLNFQLHIPIPDVLIDRSLHGQVDGHAGLELVAPVGAVEGDTSQEGVVLFDLELDVVAGLADAAGGAGDLDGLAEEGGFGVAGAEGAEALHGGDDGLVEITEGGEAVEFDFFFEHFVGDDLPGVMAEGLAEVRLPAKT